MGCSIKLAKTFALLAAGAMAFSATAFAKPYEYGLELVSLQNSPIVNNMDFEEAKAKNDCFCVSDIDGNGWLEFTIAKMDETGMYLDYACYEYDSEREDVLKQIEIRPPEAGFKPRFAGMAGENKLTAYRVIDENNREERYYHVDTSYRKKSIPWLQDGEYIVARQLVNKSNNMLFTYLAATEQGVIKESETRPGMLNFIPEKYTDPNGAEINKEAFERSADVYIVNAEKVEATFLWIPVAELEKAIGLGRDETWEVLQKSWQGFRFGNGPQGADPTGDRPQVVY
ncbi:MAG: hypothetical protein J6Z82_08655 [Schwartzia sp.]|nr:hypothetical protein [Schwartzia sp. (in: firmicutes)]